MREKNNWQEQKIMSYILELVKAGFTVELNKGWFAIKETYKSTARDIWETKEVYSTIGGKPFDKEWLRITLDKIKREKEKLLTPNPLT